MNYGMKARQIKGFGSPGPSSHLCDYCGNPAIRVHGDAIYPHRRDLWAKRFLMCKPCDAWVGVHENSEWKPYGRLANKELRQWKMKAHREFDWIWKEGHMRRKQAYYWLAEAMDIDVHECHIGKMDIEGCKQVIWTVQNKWGVVG